MHCRSTTTRIPVCFFLVALLSLLTRTIRAEDDCYPSSVVRIASNDNNDSIPASWTLIRRGGASAAAEEKNDTVNATPQKDDDDDDDDRDDDGNPLLAMTKLFRMHNQLKALAAMPEGPVSPHNKGRGGAVAVVVKQPQQERAAASPLFGAFDTSSVAPLSSRLMRDNNSEEKITAALSLEHDKDNQKKHKENPQGKINPPPAKSENNDSSKPVLSQQRLWWNSAWQQQFPDGEAIEEIQVMTQEKGPSQETLKSAQIEKQTKIMDDGDESEEEIDELESIVKAAQEERNKNKETPPTEVSNKQAQPVEDGDSTTRLVLIPKDSQSGKRLPPTLTQPLKHYSASPYESSGLWRVVDGVFSGGLSSVAPSLRISRQWRIVRKQSARVTGLHGLFSGKPRRRPVIMTTDETEVDEEMGMVRRRLEAINRARGNLGLTENESAARQRGFFGRRNTAVEEALEEAERRAAMELQTVQQKALEEARRNRVQEIDALITQGQQRLAELVTEKDILQHRPNPMWNYTTSLEELDQARRPPVENCTTTTHDVDPVKPARQFNFPPPDLVEEYLTMLFASGRLIRLNHTDLWKNNAMDEDDEDEDEWLSPMKDKMAQQESLSQKQRNGNGAGSRWLRNGLGEKLGLTVETAAYRAVGGGVMSFLARLISSIHGINVMGHTDIRLFAEQTPNLPPVAGIIPGAMGTSSYAQGAFENALRKGSRKSRKRRKRRDDSFIQRDAVVETLISQCQIAMPLLGIFPLAWQRAMLGNIVTLVTATMMDFCEGLEFQILGHRLSFSFVPITEEDMMRHLASAASDVFSRRHKDAARFETAVRSTAQDVAENLKFLDRWHERILGGDALRTQLSNLVARLVLTLVDETLSGARMDLWTTHAGGPRLISGLEYRAEDANQTVR